MLRWCIDCVLNGWFKTGRLAVGAAAGGRALKLEETCNIDRCVCVCVCVLVRALCLLGVGVDPPGPQRGH